MRFSDALDLETKMRVGKKRGLLPRGAHGRHKLRQRLVDRVGMFDGMRAQRAVDYFDSRAPGRSLPGSKTPRTGRYS